MLQDPQIPERQIGCKGQENDRQQKVEHEHGLKEHGTPHLNILLTRKQSKHTRYNSSGLRP